MPSTTDSERCASGGPAVDDGAARFRTLADHLPDLVVRYDQRLRFLYVNTAAARLARRRPEELIGQLPWELGVPAFSAVREERVAEVFTSGDDVRYELSAGEGGQTRWFDVQLVAERAQGRIESVLGIVRDVSERRQVGVAIQHDEARLQAFVRADVIGILFGDVFGGVHDCNEELARIIGRSRQDVLAGKVRWTDITPVEDLALDEKALAEATAAGHCRPYEKRYLRPDGTVVPVQVGFVLLEPERQRSVAFILDISERKAAEEALRRADQRKGEFLAVLSHELRNPLAPIRNSVYILERATPGGEQARRALSVIERQVNQMARLIDDLLDVTRISRGKIRLQREPLWLDEVVRGVGEDLRELFRRSGLELEVAVPDRPLRALVDRTRMAQVVGNLLQNAAKFTPRGGHVRLSLEVGADGQAVIEVRDDGIGIEPRLREKLFEPFVQGDQAIDRSHGGLGLGLALVKGLTELHGGTAAVASAGPGKGTAFTLRLPLEEQPRPAAQ